MKQYLRRILSVLFSLLVLSFVTYGEGASWDCPECGRLGNTGNFCGGCAHPAPWISNSPQAQTETNVPEGYPSIIEGLDFNGKDVYIYDWWSDDTRSSNPSREQKLQYDYQDWIMETYNVKVHVTALSDWAGNPTELANMVANKNNSRLCILCISSDFVGASLANGLYMPWTYGLDQGIFNNAAIDFMTKNGKCYGATMGAAIEPRQGVFFNKRILEEAKIDWNELYDMQASGNWTWDKMEEYMEKVQRDNDMDGEPDVWALTGNGDDVTIGLVVSNEADFYRYNEAGKLVPAIDSDEMKEALERRISWGEKYMRPNAAWDDYQMFWPEGNVAFMIGQSYEGFNGNGTINRVADDWGFVALPKGPRAKRYTSAAEFNIYGIPNVYDEETSLKLQQLFTLWVSPVPGIDKDAWSTSFYALTDSRAIEETYAMLRQGTNATVMKFNLVGNRNSSITEITWNLGGGTPDEIIAAALPAFQKRCDAFNSGKIQ